MKNVIKKLSQLHQNGQLVRALFYKLMVKSGIGRFFNFTTQGLRLQMFSSDMTIEAF
jgi:hypothetical protein